MFFQQNGFETALCKLSVVVFWSQRVKTTQKKIITVSTQLGPTRHIWVKINLLSGVPDYFYRNKISSGGDLSHYSSASLY